MESIDVLTVGNALVDVQARAEDSFINAEGLVKGSMQLIDDDRSRDLYQNMGPASESSGGSAANTATGVVVCGGTAAFIGTVAYDQLGEIFTHDIRAAGVSYKTPPVAGAVTGRSLILVTPDGERTMNTSIGAASRVAIGKIDEKLLRAARVTYIEGFLLDVTPSVTDWQRCADIIHDAGNLYALTLADSFCVQRHRDLFMELLDGPVDVCFGNEDELKMLYESSDLDECLERISKQCKYVAITRGARGSVVCCDGEWMKIAAEQVEVVDTTGAGDLYAAGFLFGLAQGWDVALSGHLATHAAGAVVSQMGARLQNDVHISLP